MTVLAMKSMRSQFDRPWCLSRMRRIHAVIPYTTANAPKKSDSRKSDTRPEARVERAMES